MIPHNDADPLPKIISKGNPKTKKLLIQISKIKPILHGAVDKTAKTVFLIETKSRFALAKLKNILKLFAVSICEFFSADNKLLPHFSLGVIGSLVLLSNFIVKYAEADYSVSYPDPANEIAIAGITDTFTPLIENDGMSAEKAYKNSTEAFFAVSNSIDTNITQREEPLPDNSQQTVSYTVRNGDNLTTLGWKFEVKLATLMYVNDLDNANLVKPGQVLKVPPKGYEVSASAIAKREKEKLAQANRNTVIRESASSRSRGSTSVTVRTAAGSSKNGYPYGYCTYYVATKRYVPSSWGNAKNWLNSARRAGYSTGNQPASGAIGVTPESWWGHVVYVESVNGNMVTFSEMNAVGWGKVSRRTLPVSSFRGFIY